MTRNDELMAARREFESRLGYVRQTMGRKTGLRPKRAGWWMVLLAGAVGMALAGRSQRKRQLERES